MTVSAAVAVIPASAVAWAGQRQIVSGDSRLPTSLVAGVHRTSWHRYREVSAKTGQWQLLPHILARTP